MTTTNMLDVIKSNYERRRAIQGELRSIDEATITDPDKGAVRAYSPEEEAQISSLRAELETVDSRLTSVLEMESRAQAIHSGIDALLGAKLDASGTVEDTRSIGERFTNEGYADWAAQARGRFVADMDLEFRAVTDTTTDAGSAGSLTRPTRLARIGRDDLDRRVFLLDLLPVIPVNQGTIEYVQDVSPLADLANKAAEVSETATKPQAGVTFELKTESAAVISAWVNITRQAAADVPQVQAYLDNRLRYSVKRRADAQAISGDGSAPNLRGLTNRTGIVTYAPGSAEPRYQSVRHTIRLMEDEEAVPEIIVMNPADAELFDLSNHAADGLHAVPNLAEAGARSSWGLTQVRSTAIASGTALLIDPMAVAVFDRQQVTAHMTDSHASNFTSNILTLLLEARIGLGLFDPAGVGEVTFNGTA